MAEQVPSVSTFEQGEPTSDRAVRTTVRPPALGVSAGTSDALLGEVERIAHLGGFVWTRGDERVHWSEELYRMLGYDPGEVEPTEEAFLAAVHPDDRARVRDAWAAACDGALDYAEYRIVHQRTEEVRYVRASGQPYIEAGEVKQIIGAVQDITEARRAAHALEEAKAERAVLEEQLRHAARMEAIGTLAAAVAHDFNNYLMVLDQSLTMLIDTDGPERDDLVASGRLALSRSRDLTRQLLAFARRQPFSPESVDLTEVVRNFYDLLHRAVGRRAALRMERGAAPLWCRVDPRHVERMLTNLVVNAADAIEETRGGASSGRITVRLESLDLPSVRRAIPGDVPAGAYACIIVEDDGGGIDAARLPRIFEPYFTTKPAGRGTGLGLASVYGMARQNEGQVTVSELPNGTRFTLWFPRREEESGSRAYTAPLTLPPPASAFDHLILIVEDIEPVRLAAERILNAAGFRTIVASNGREALELLDSGENVRLILTDLEMPVMGGRELADRVQWRPDAPPVIFMTGFSEDTQLGSGELGQMLLAKPFTPERMVEFVKRALRNILPR
jgi:PAS domain S-box-containing protein